jgi:hypothetical protein
MRTLWRITMTLPGGPRRVWEFRTPTEADAVAEALTRAPVGATVERIERRPVAA